MVRKTRINIKSYYIKLPNLPGHFVINRAGKGASGKMVYELIRGDGGKYSIRDGFYIYVNSNGKVLYKGHNNLKNILKIY